MQNNKKNTKVTKVTTQVSRAIVPAPARVTQTVQRVQQQPQRQRRQVRRRGRNRSSVSLRDERYYFDTRLTAPDLYGPFRQPRAGGGTKTGLGMDITYGNLVTTGSADAVQFLQVSSNLMQTAEGARLAKVAATSTNFGTFTAVPTATVWPFSSAVADVNMTAACLVVYYIGNPLSVAGELIIGSCIPAVSTTTVDALYVYPSTLKVPIAHLVNNPLRVYMRKMSSAADEFLPVGTNQADVDMPWIAFTGLPNGQNIRYQIMRTYEYRTSTTSPTITPYERVGPSFSKDVSAYQDARATLAEMPAAVQAALPETGPVRQDAEALASGLGYGNLAGSALVGAGVGLVAALGNYHMNRLRASAHGGGGGNIFNV